MGCFSFRETSRALVTYSFLVVQIQQLTTKANPELTPAEEEPCTEAKLPVCHESSFWAKISSSAPVGGSFLTITMDARREIHQPEQAERWQRAKDHHAASGWEGSGTGPRGGGAHCRCRRGRNEWLQPPPMQFQKQERS